MLIGLVLCYLKRREFSNTIYYSHFSGIIRLFWNTLLFVIVAFFVAFLLVKTGYSNLVPGITFLLIGWVIYYYFMLIQGLVRLTRSREFNGTQAII